MCTRQLIEPRGGTRQPSDDNPKALNCCTNEIGAAKVVKKNWFQQSHETSPQGKHNLTLLQNQLMCFNNKQKMPWISKTYKLYINLFKHLKLIRVNILILVHLETSNKELKSGKDKDHNKYYQDGLTRDSYPSKPGLQLIHFKKYASLQTFVNSYYITSKPKSLKKSNKSIRFILTCNYYFHTHRVNTRSSTLFHNSQLQSHPSSASNHTSQMSPGAAQGTQDMEIADITSEKRQASHGNSQPIKKPTPDATKGTSPSNLNMHDLWLGFQNMEMLAIDLSVEPYTYSLEACLQAGIPSKEACELVSA